MTHGKPIAFLATAAAVPLSALAVAACGSSSGSNTSASTAPPTTAGGRPATIGVQNTNLGKVLDNTKGLTLYLFKKDTGTKSACFGGCATAWPPVRAAGKPVVGTGAKPSLASTAPRSDGKPQVTYNGHPLYTYSGDQKPGDTTGQGLVVFGGGWFALSPAGNQVAGKPSGSSSVPGY